MCKRPISERVLDSEENFAILNLKKSKNSLSGHASAGSHVKCEFVRNP